MSNYAIRGLAAPVPQWAEVHWDSSAGYALDQEFQGFDYNAMERLANQFNSYGVGTVLRFQAGKATLHTRDTTGQVSIDKWEIGVDREQPSVWENPKVAAAVNRQVAPETVMAMIKAAIQNNTDWDTLANDTDFQTAAGTMEPEDAQLLGDVLTDYYRGVTNFIRSKYVLRHTTNAPNRWRVNVADLNVEKIYSIAQLLSECQNPNLWVFPLPGYLAYKIQTYEQPAAVDHYFWGALKMRSNAVTVADNRVEIGTEYLIDAINTNLYDYM